MAAQFCGITRTAPQAPRRAAANDFDFKTRAARGSVCNGLLCSIVSVGCQRGKEICQCAVSVGDAKSNRVWIKVTRN